MVEAAIDVGEYRELELEMGAVRSKTLGVVGEGDDDREGVAELAELIAHGDHVLLAGKSSEVAVQYEHQRPAAMVAEPPRVPLMINEGDVGEEVTLSDHGVRSHAQIRSAPTAPPWNVGER